MATTSERLREIISIREIKQVELLEKTGISKGALSSYISGRYVPKQDNIYKLAKALAVNPAWLMGLDVPMEPAASSGSAPAAMPSPAGLSLSAVEEEIILKFRAADEFDQETVLRTLRIKREEYTSSQAG